jgi:hypothetical protein
MANQNDYLVYGWDVQTLGAVAGQSGYAQPGNAPQAPVVSAAEQVSAGAPFPANPGVTQVLENPGYAASPANMTPGLVTAPAIPASTVAASNPSGLAATVQINGGTVTAISIASAGSSTFTQVGTTTPATVTVPPGGQIKMTYSVVPTSWTWTAVN